MPHYVVYPLRSVDLNLVKRLWRQTTWDVEKTLDFADIDHLILLTSTAVVKYINYLRVHQILCKCVCII